MAKFELLETKDITVENGQKLTIGIIDNVSTTETTRGVLSIVLSAETEEGEKIFFTEECNDGVMATVTIEDIKGNTHPEQIRQFPFLLKELLAYQEKNGPFLAGQKCSFREILKERDENFFRAMFTDNIPETYLNDSLASLTRVLIEQNKFAKRISPMPDYATPTVGINMIASGLKIYGVNIKDNDKPEDDIILKFIEGPEGETSYYIDGDIIVENRFCILNFHITQEEPKWGEKIKEAEDGYVNLRLSKSDDQVEGWKRYFLFRLTAEEKVDEIARKIYKPMSIQRFMRRKW